MFPSALITALITLGSGCLILSVSIFHYFRERVSRLVLDNTTRILTSKETLAFLKAVKAEEVTTTMLSAFFQDLLAIWRPKQRLKKLWAYFPTSGVLFIFVGLLGSFAETDTQLFDYATYTILAIAIIFFLLGVWQLYRLGSKLVGA